LFGVGGAGSGASSSAKAKANPPQQNAAKAKAKAKAKPALVKGKAKTKKQHADINCDVIVFFKACVMFFSAAEVMRARCVIELCHFGDCQPQPQVDTIHHFLGLVAHTWLLAKLRYMPSCAISPCWLGFESELRC
jgi:hypothetical protein